MDESRAERVLSLVPDIFYDLISRITPSFLLIILLLFQINILDNLCGSILIHCDYIEGIINKEATITFYILLLFLSYLLGILLSPFGRAIYLIQEYFIRKMLKRNYLKKIENITGNIKGLFYNCNKGKHKDSPFCCHTNFEINARIIRDFFSSRYPARKKILTKTSAEAALCNNLAAGLIIQTIILSFINPCAELEVNPMLVVTIPALLISVFAGYHRSWRAHHRHYSFILMLAKLEKNASNRSQSYFKILDR